MERAPDLADFLAGPPGRYAAGRTWLEFCSADGVAGHVLWGRPNREDASHFMREKAPAGSALAAQRPRYFDVRRLESPDAGAFAVFAARLLQHGPRLTELVTRVAVVHRGGLSGALVEGFGKVAFTPFPVSFFTEPVRGLEWLGAPDPSALAAELDALHAHATGTTPALRDLRALLRASLAGPRASAPRGKPTLPSLSDAAAELGLSTRALQRTLRDVGTSFQEERTLARFEAAKRRLLETESTVEEIAYALGFASVHHFSTLFRDASGQTPTHWREEARASKKDP